jgi:hypothetical protein
MKLIPADSSVVLTVDDLRGQVRDLLNSKLAAEFQKLPVVKAWLDSEKYEQLETSRDQIEGMLQAKVTEIRDQVLGDAVVLALRLPPDGPVDPSRAQGLLVFKARDPALVKRLCSVINSIQTGNGEIASVMERSYRETSYFVRMYPAGSNRPPDAFVTFADGTFAISNSLQLIHHVIDQKLGAAGGASAIAADRGLSERFQATSRRLPDRALARLFFDPRLAEKLLKNDPKPRAAGEAALERFISSLDSAGAALVIRDGNVAVHIAEIFEPSKFHELLDRWTGGSSLTAARLDHVPSTTWAVGSIRLDFTALYQTLLEMAPEEQKHRVPAAETVLRGLLLGQDLRTRVLPALGPRVLAVLDAPVDGAPRSETDRFPGRNWPFPTVLALELGPEPEPKQSRDSSKLPQAPVADALDNVLNTLLAFVTFDERLGQGRAKIVSRQVAGLTVKSLDPQIPFAYAVDRAGHRLVLGNSLAAVERYLAASADPLAGTRFRRLQARGFAEAQSFLCLDLAAVEAMITKHRERLTETIAGQEHRSRQDVAHDLDQVVALSQLFDAAFVTNRIDANSATVFHALGLLARQAGEEASRAQP